MVALSLHFRKTGAKSWHDWVGRLSCRPGRRGVRDYSSVTTAFTSVESSLHSDWAGAQHWHRRRRNGAWLRDGCNSRDGQNRCKTQPPAIPPSCDFCPPWIGCPDTNWVGCGAIWSRASRWPRTCSRRHWATHRSQTCRPRRDFTHVCLAAWSSGCSAARGTRSSRSRPPSRC